MGAFRIGIAVAMLWSCAGERMRETGRETVAHLDAPAAHVERVTYDDVHTAGIGCTNGGGGRGSVPMPSLSNTRLWTTHDAYTSCVLTVGTATTTEYACSTAAVELRADPEGDRFAVRNAGRAWQVFVGGAAGLLVTDLEPESADSAREYPGDLDWTKVQPAVAVLTDAYRAVAAREAGDTTNHDRALGLLAELQAVDPAGYAARLIELAESDRGLHLCREDTAWVLAGKALPVADRTTVLARFLPSLDASDGPTWQRDHALALLDRESLLAHVADAGRFIDAHAADADPWLAADVLDAWSLQNARAAGVFACTRLANPASGPARVAALLAVGRAGIPCKAVAANLHGLDCTTARDGTGDLPDRDAAVDAVRDLADDRVARCHPGLAGVLAGQSQGLDAAVLEAMCVPRHDGVADAP